MFNFKDAPVTIYNGVRDTKGRAITLGEFMNRRAYDYLEGDEKRALPCITYGGRFKGRKAAHLMAASGVIQLDWDAKDNPFTDLEAMKRYIAMDHPESYVAISASGRGIYGLFFYPELVDMFDKYGAGAYLRQHTAHTKALARHYWEELGLVADTSMLARPSGLRFVSADPAPVYGEAVHVENQIFAA